jgi:hypothetical protein
MKMYKSKISWGLVAVPYVLFIGMVLFMIIKKDPLSAVLVTNGILLSVALFTTYLVFSIRYTIDKGVLYVSCGFLYRRHLDISRITTIKETKDIISAPAASLDRLLINYDAHGVLIISPKNKGSFIKDLIKINPTIIYNATT